MRCGLMKFFPMQDTTRQDRLTFTYYLYTFLTKCRLMQDYFLGTYYFNKGAYTNQLAGVTFLNRTGSHATNYPYPDPAPDQHGAWFR